MLIRTQFPDLHLVDMLPALDELIFQKFDRFPAQWEKVFQVLSSTRDIEQTTQLSGLGLPAAVAEGAPVGYDQPNQGFDKTYVHSQFGLGFKISKPMAMNDKHGIIAKMAGELGRSFKEFLEIEVANHFNRGFSASYPGLDGVPLFSASHPLIKAGGVQSNTLSTPVDLDHSSLQLALTQFRKMVDTAGKKHRVKPSKLIVAPEGEFNAAETLGKAEWRPDTANNTPNALQRRSGFGPFNEFVVWDYLTDPDAWFITADKEDTELRFYWRERLNSVHEIDFDTRTIKTAMWGQWSHGWSDYQGVFGSPGA